MKRALFAAFAVCAVLVPSAGAAPRISALDTSSFPELRVTIVAPLGAKAPTLRENGKAVAALSAVNLGRTKSIMLALDRSQSMRGRPLANAIAAAAVRSPVRSAPRTTSASSPSATTPSR